MNILFTWPIHIDPQSGGVERVTDLLAREFVKRGHSVFFLHTSHFGQRPVYDYNVSIDYLESKDITGEITHSEYRTYLEKHHIDVVINQAGAFSDALLFGDITSGKQLCLHVIHCNPKFYYNHYFTVISRLRTSGVKEYLKCILRVILYPILKSRYLANLRNHYHNLLNSPSKNIILLSERYRESLKEILHSYPDENITAIGNPASFEIRERERERENVILYVGRFDRTFKRPDRVIAIWKKLHSKFHDWSVIMIGDGPERNNLEKLAVGLPRIEFVGFTPPEVYYKKAKLLLMTSNVEGFPMVLLEAMCFGCVPMAFDSFNSVRDLIRNDDQLIKPFSLYEYARKMGKIMSNPSLFVQLQKNGFKIAREFEIGKIADKWESIIYAKLSKIQGTNPKR